ncbi:uncharacterized protein V1516DRAFT_681162 [Lipomyces oligophaga]|uniref:uncharacterized protein n=1 Tax=Lipomyces oligophaga TaxID=45792 RepID=UPI0034CD7A52
MSARPSSPSSPSPVSASATASPPPASSPQTISPGHPDQLQLPLQLQKAPVTSLPQQQQTVSSPAQTTQLLPPTSTPISNQIHNLQHQESGSAHPRKRSKVSRACDECRRKKIRCDASPDIGQEQCSSCKRVGEKCSFSRIPMKRGPSKGYIKELEDRLNSLESSIGADSVPHSRRSSAVGPTDLPPQSAQTVQTTSTISSALAPSHPAPIQTSSANSSTSTSAGHKTSISSNGSNTYPADSPGSQYSAYSYSGYQSVSSPRTAMGENNAPRSRAGSLHALAPLSSHPSTSSAASTPSTAVYSGALGSPGLAPVNGIRQQQPPPPLLQQQQQQPLAQQQPPQQLQQLSSLPPLPRNQRKRAFSSSMEYSNDHSSWYGSHPPHMPLPPKPHTPPTYLPTIDALGSANSTKQLPPPPRLQSTPVGPNSQQFPPPPPPPPPPAPPSSLPSAPIQVMNPTMVGPSQMLQRPDEGSLREDRNSQSIWKPSYEVSNRLPPPHRRSVASDTADPTTPLTSFSSNQPPLASGQHLHPPQRQGSAVPSFPLPLYNVPVHRHSISASPYESNLPFYEWNGSNNSKSVHPPTPLPQTTLAPLRPQPSLPPLNASRTPSIGSAPPNDTGANFRPYIETSSHILFAWDDEAVESYYSEIAKYVPLLPSTSGVLKARLVATTPPIRNACLHALYGLIRGHHSPKRGSQDKQRAMAYLMDADVDGAGAAQFASSLLAIQTLALCALEVSNRGVGPLTSVMHSTIAWLGCAIGFANGLRLFDYADPLGPDFQRPQLHEGEEIDLNNDACVARRTYLSLFLIDRWNAAGQALPHLLIVGGDSEIDGVLRLTATDELIVGQSAFELIRMTAVLGDMIVASNSGQRSEYAANMIFSALERCREESEQHWSSTPLLAAVYWHLRLLAVRLFRPPDAQMLLPHAAHVVTLVAQNILPISRTQHQDMSPAGSVSGNGSNMYGSGWPVQIYYHLLALALHTLLELVDFPETSKDAWPYVSVLHDSLIAVTTYTAQVSSDSTIASDTWPIYFLHHIDQKRATASAAASNGGVPATPTTADSTATNANSAIAPRSPKSSNVPLSPRSRTGTDKQQPATELDRLAAIAVGEQPAGDGHANGSAVAPPTGMQASSQAIAIQNEKLRKLGYLGLWKKV